MTKRDYEMMAKILQSSTSKHDFVIKFLGWQEQENPRFLPEKFWDACFPGENRRDNLCPRA